MSVLRLSSIIVSVLLACSACATDNGVSTADDSDYKRPGYATEVHDGRLWVFEDGSEDYEKFKKGGAPDKNVSRIAAGPGGITLRGIKAEVIDGYLASRPGYVAEVHDGRLWVFEAGSEDYKKFKAGGVPDKNVSRIAAGPNGMTVRSTTVEVIDGYLAAKEY